MTGAEEYDCCLLKRPTCYVSWVSAVSIEKVAQDFSKLADIVRHPGQQTLDQASKFVAMRG